MTDTLQILRDMIVAVMAGLAILALVPPAPAAAASSLAQFNSTAELQIVKAVNTDRAAVGLPPLMVDPQLTDIARQRDQYMLDQGIAGAFDRWFSHCLGGGQTCPPTQYQFGALLQQRGLPESNAAENLAVTTDPADQLAATTTIQWMASPHHRPNIENPAFNATGAGVVYCFTIQGDGQIIGGLNNDQPVNQDIPNVALVVQVFEQYSPAKVQLLQRGKPAAASAIPDASCHLQLGFKALYDLAPTAVGDCVDNEAHDPQTGDAIQHSAGGLLVWRSADNWTAFTNGSTTWINGPYGLVQRLNTLRFAWEANLEGFPVVS